MTKGKKGFIETAVTFADDATAVDIGSLPPNSLITDVIVLASVAFNDGTATVLDVGIKGGDVDKFVDGLDVQAVGRLAVTHLNMGAVQSTTDSTELIATASGTDSDATAGACRVIVEYAQL